MSFGKRKIYHPALAVWIGVVTMARFGFHQLSRLERSFVLQSLTSLNKSSVDLCEETHLALFLADKICRLFSTRTLTFGYLLHFNIITIVAIIERFAALRPALIIHAVKLPIYEPTVSFYDDSKSHLYCKNH